MTFNTYYKRRKTIGEVNNEKSKTIPDQSMTIREIINRTQKGLPITGVRVPVYNETEDGIMPDLRNMDISEIYALKEKIKDTEKQLRKQLQEQEEQEQLLKTEEYYKKKFGAKPEVKPEVITPTEEV